MISSTDGRIVDVPNLVSFPLRCQKLDDCLASYLAIAVNAANHVSETLRRNFCKHKGRERKHFHSK